MMPFFQNYIPTDISCYRSLFGVCLFLGVRLSRQNKKNRKKGRAKKKMEGTNGPDPLLMGMTTMGLILVM